MSIRNEEKADFKLIEQSRNNQAKIIEKIKNNDIDKISSEKLEQSQAENRSTTDNSMSFNYEEKLREQQIVYENRIKLLQEQIEELKQKNEIANRTGYQIGYDEGYCQGLKEKNNNFSNEVQSTNFERNMQNESLSATKTPVNDNAINTLEDLMASIFGSSEEEEHKKDVR